MVRPFQICIAGVNFHDGDMAGDVSRATEELLKNLCESNNIPANVFRDIYSPNAYKSIQWAFNQGAQLCVLFSTSKKQQPLAFSTDPYICTLSGIDPRIVSEVSARFFFHNLRHGSITLQRNNTYTFRLLNACHNAGMQYLGISCGNFYSTSDLNEISRNAPNIARATAQGLYRYLATTKVHPQRKAPEGTNSSPATEGEPTILSASKPDSGIYCHPEANFLTEGEAILE